MNVKEKSNDGKYYFIPSGANFSNGFKLDRIKKISEEEFRSIAGEKILQVGDILFNSGGVGTLGRSSYFYGLDDQAVADSFIIVIRDYTKLLNRKYIYYWFQSAVADKLIKENTRGTTGITSIKSKDIERFEIPFAPLAEQHRIVAKLDELMEKIYSSRVRLERIPKILKRFRQSILAAAVSGRLTEEWRRDNPNVKAAKILIEELIRDRKNKNPKARVNLEPIEIDVEIPEKWAWSQLLNVSEVIGGVTKGRKFNGKKTIKLPYLRVANVQDGYLDLSEIKTIDVLPGDLEKYRLIKDDILFTEGGDRDKLGRGTVWNNEVKDCIHQNHIFRARAFSTHVLPEYVSLYTKSEGARSYFFENASQTVNLASINLTTLANVPIAVPPFEEQQKIVHIVNQLFTQADKIEIRYKKARAHLDKLPQSLLTKAFRGELVAQDENDKSASLLLEQIRVESKSEKSKSIPIKRQSKKLIAMELLEILQKAQTPLTPRDVWQMSRFKNDIDGFYKELKREVNELKRIKESKDKKHLELIK